MLQGRPSLGGAFESGLEARAVKTFPLPVHEAPAPAWRLAGDGVDDLILVVGTALCCTSTAHNQHQRSGAAEKRRRCPNDCFSRHRAGADLRLVARRNLRRAEYTPSTRRGDGVGADIHENPYAIDTTR